MKGEKNSYYFSQALKTKGSCLQVLAILNKKHSLESALGVRFIVISSDIIEPKQNSI